ncbi:endolytic transglycosylase MltG [Micromonospora sp. NPDC049559]|uniref:endolytic transglycosylase MltG n=1 Tax=Micromonospora sp. NPDC049559 TaxID=3155923 RepID=UPI00343638BD
MIDELDLVFEDEDHDGGGRHTRSAARRRKKKSGGRGRTILALLMAFVLLGVLGGGVWYGFDRVQSFFTTPDYEGAGTGEILVEVKAGDLSADIGTTLYEKDVVKSQAAFVKAAKANSRSKNIQPGFYRLRKQMSAENALGLLLDLKNKVTKQVTIPEGLSYQQTFEALAKATGIPVKEFADAAKDPVALGVPDWWFKRDDGKKLNKSIEGFLYPETYEFPPNASATDMLKTMVEHFNNEMGEINFADTVQQNLHISPYEALIAASIAQAEAMHDKDMGPVVRVLYNRAYGGNFPCSCLGLDSTVNYWLRITGQGSKASEHLSNADLHNPKNPYNTHDFPGMPIGPIGNPGKAAIEGAMSPPPSKNVYFVSIDTKGTMAYATSWSGHQANIQKACQNGIPLC